jgi:hypothetical protein
MSQDVRLHGLRVVAGEHVVDAGDDDQRRRESCLEVWPLGEDPRRRLRKLLRVLRAPVLGRERCDVDPI